MRFGAPSAAGSVASLPAACSGSAGPVCAGTVTVSAASRIVGRARYALAAGRTATLRIALNGRGRHLLDRTYKLPAELIVSGTGSFDAPLLFAYKRIVLHLDPFTYTFFGSSTVLDPFTLTGVPAHASVRVSCRGGGCPFAVHVVKRPPRRIVLGRLFSRARLSLGTRVVLRVTAPGRVGVSGQLTMRRETQPAQRTQCLPPGYRRPVRCPVRDKHPRLRRHRASA